MLRWEFNVRVKKPKVFASNRSFWNSRDWTSWNPRFCRKVGPSLFGFPVSRTHRFLATQDATRGVAACGGEDELLGWSFLLFKRSGGYVLTGWCFSSLEVPVVFWNSQDWFRSSAMRGLELKIPRSHLKHGVSPVRPFHLGIAESIMAHNMSDGQNMACFSERKGMVTSIHQGIDVAAL